MSKKIECPVLQVVPGQIWESCDPRDRGPDGRKLRRILVLKVDKARANCQVVGGSRCSYIKLTRFRPTSTGYRFVGFS